MKILVAIKRVVDPGIAPRVASDGLSVVTDHIKTTMNPYDENALEAAVQLKEAKIAKEIVAVSVGPKEVVESLRAALALGATRAVHVACSDSLESLAVAKALARICETEQPDLVLLGRQAVDGDVGATGPMLAAKLDWPQATCASELAIVGNELTVRQSADDGSVTMSCSLPAVVTADFSLNTPRTPSFPSIVAAKRAKIDTLDLAALGVEIAPRHIAARYDEIDSGRKGEILPGIAELLPILRSAVSAAS